MILSKYRARLGDITFGESDPETGENWIVYDLEGWQNTGTTGQTTQRSAANGGWRNRAYRPSKGYTLTGSVFTDQPNAPDALDRLLDNIPLDQLAPLAVYGVHASGDRQVFVRQEGDVSTKIISDYEASFSIGLVAPDPLKYGTEQHVTATNLPSTTGGLTVPFKVPFAINSVTVSGVAQPFNAGNEPVSPRAIIYGPVANPRLTNQLTGEVLQVNLTLATGEYLDLDFARHTAHLNGTASRRGYVSGPWFSLTPGLNLIDFNSSVYSATASVQVIWFDGWK